MGSKSAEIAAIRERLQFLNKLNNDIEKRIIAGSNIAVDTFGDSLSYELIVSRINEIADRIVADYNIDGEPPVLVSLMDGAFPFASMLQNALIARGFDFQYTTMQISSYDYTESGTVKISSPPKVKLGERKVIIVDEVWDTGKTFANAQNYVLDCGAKSVDFAVLVDKAPDPKELSMVRVQPRCLYNCFTTSPDAFLIGMGLDYSGGCRNLLDIRVVDLSTLPTAAEKALLNEIKPLNERLQQLLIEQKLEAKYESGRKSPLRQYSFIDYSYAANVKDAKDVEDTKTVGILN